MEPCLTGGTSQRERHARIAIVLPHPTQFDAPLLKYLSNRSELTLEVYFLRSSRGDDIVDPELGHPPGWDFDQTEGYSYQLVGKGIRAVVRCARLLIARDFDLVVLPGWGSPFDLVLLALSRVLRSRVAVITDTTSLYKRRRSRRILRRALLVPLLRRTPAFLARGTLATAHLLELGVRPDRIFSYPYSIDGNAWARTVDTLRQEARPLKQAYGITSGPVVLGVLKFVEREGVHDLVEAFLLFRQGCPSAVLLLVGDGPERDRITARLTNEPGGSVVLAGYQPYSELPRFYAIADVFVHPGHMEPWGVSMNEALASRLPVIASDKVGAAHDLVLPGVNGWIYPSGRAHCLADALVEFARAPVRAVMDMGDASCHVVAAWGFGRNLSALLGASNSVVHRN